MDVDSGHLAKVGDKMLEIGKFFIQVIVMQGRATWLMKEVSANIGVYPAGIARAKVVPTPILVSKLMSIC